MKKPDFRPLGNRYLVLSDPIEDESETIGDVTLSKPKDPNKQAEEGTVVARGKSCVDVEVGAKVYYGKFSGYDRQIDGVDYKILQENELLGEHFVTPLDKPGQLTPIAVPPGMSIREYQRADRDARVQVDGVIPVNDRHTFGTCHLCGKPCSQLMTACAECLAPPEAATDGPEKGEFRVCEHCGIATSLAESPIRCHQCSHRIGHKNNCDCAVCEMPF